MYMIMFVLDDPEFLDRILQAWTKAQIKGCTIVESTGLYRNHHKHVPMRYAYSSETPVEQGNVTIFAIVEREETVRACLDAAESVVGNLDEPNTGVFTAWPLPIVKGVPIS